MGGRGPHHPRRAPCAAGATGRSRSAAMNRSYTVGVELGNGVAVAGVPHPTIASQPKRPIASIVGLMVSLRTKMTKNRRGGSGTHRVFLPRAVALITVWVLMTLGAAACETEDELRNPVVQSEPTASQTRQSPGVEVGLSPWPPAEVKFSREQAIQIARKRCTGSSPEVTAVENPHDPVARLMPVSEFEDRVAGRSSPHGADQLVWVVQLEGESFGAGIAAVSRRQPPPFHYVACAVDAQSGEVTRSSRTRAQPVFLPTGISPIVPSPAFDPNLGSAVEARGTVGFNREAAIELVRSVYRSAPGLLVDRAEIELVRYSGYCPGQGLFPSPTPGGPPNAPSPGVQCGLEWAFSQPSTDRLTWLVIIPVALELDACGPSRAPDNPLAPNNTCWSQQIFTLIDAETGKQYGDGGNGRGGPLVTNEEHQALVRFAWAEGWWELWHQVKDYGGQQLPEGLAASLDRPDAPTPTPTRERTVPPDATPSPTPATRTRRGPRACKRGERCHPQRNPASRSLTSRPSP